MNRTRLPAFQRSLHRWVLGLALLCAGVAASAQQGPPGEVARLNVQEGAVSVSPAGQDRWYAARPDRPLTVGDRLRTERNARAEVTVGEAALRLDGGTDVAFSGPDQITVERGDIQLRVAEGPSDQGLRIETGNLAADIGGPGEYRFSADSATTWVAVASGRLTLHGLNGATQRLTDRQQTTVSGRNLAAARNTRPQNSSFDAWLAERDRYDSAPRYGQPAVPSAAMIARQQELEYERARQSQQAQWLEQQRAAQTARQLQDWQRDQEWRQQQEWQQQQDWRRQQDWRQRAEQDRWQQQRQQQQVQQQLQQQQQQALRQQQELQLRAAQAQAQQQQQLLQQQQRAAQQAAQVQQQQQQLRQQQELQLRAAQMQQQALAQQQAQQNAMRQAQEAQLRAIQQQRGIAPAAPPPGPDDPRRLWTSPDSR